MPDNLNRNSRRCPDSSISDPGEVMNKQETYLEMRLKIESVFENYAAQSEYYKRANLVQRFAMMDAFYRLSMEMLAKII